jgi:hypothetical protein
MTNLRSILAAAFAILAAPALAQNQAALPWNATDLGSFHSGCMKVKFYGEEQVVAKGIAIKVGEGSVLFDPELMRWSAAWSGGFIEFPRGRGGLEGTIKPVGEGHFGTTPALGWSAGEIAPDPRPGGQGNLPKEAVKWRGLFTHGEKVVLAYDVAKASVFEVPGFSPDRKVFTRTFTVSALPAPHQVLLAQLPSAVGAPAGDGSVVIEAPGEGGAVRALAVKIAGAPNGAKLSVASEGRVVLQLPKLTSPATFTAAIWAGPKQDLPDLAGLIPGREALPKPADLIKGGPARWGQPLVTQGKLSDTDDAYVIDEIPLPEDNPFKSWMRPGGHDFLPDGRCVLANISGDVWLVDGLDEKLEEVTWKRIATGLCQPLGCKVVDGKVYVLGRDQITRLHDLNGDGEVDFYENFNNDCVATDNYHEFALDLQTDQAGNFYFAKGSPWQPNVTSPHQGCMVKVSKDGSKLEIFATGLRAPNGLGMGPGDELTCSDNQGHWMPANRLNLVKQGGFYGMVPAAQRELTFRRVDGTEFKANPSTDAARREHKTNFWGDAKQPVPTLHDPPLVWLPMNVDNSPGGEVWAPKNGKWGALDGAMLHLSYGRCILYNVLQEEVDGVAQGAVVRLAGKFSSGIMRGRFHPKDGQLYVSGLSVWQSDAAKVGCFSRVRFTGKASPQPVGIRTMKNGVAVTFSAPLDAASAADAENWSAERWNYRWTGAYGSRDYSVSDPEREGKELMLIDKAEVSADGRTVTLVLQDLRPADQMKLSYRIKSADGIDLRNEIYQTIHRVPGAVAGN